MLKILSLCIDKNDFYNVWELIFEHCIHKGFLISFEIQFVLTELLLGPLEKFLTFIDHLSVIYFEILNEVIQPG